MLSDSERAIIDALSERPLRRDQIARAVSSIVPQLLPLGRLMRLGGIRRAAFTPTDALHVLRKFAAYDVDAAVCVAEILRRTTKLAARDFAQRVCDECERRVARQIMRRELTGELGDPEQENGGLLHALLDRILKDRTLGDTPWSLRFTERRPVAGIGAPSMAFMPGAAALLDAHCVIPPNAEVANAIGAVVANVIVRERVIIRPDETGAFIMLGPFGRKEFSHLVDAQNSAAARLAQYLRHKAIRSGTDEQAVKIIVQEQTGLLVDGGEQFLELVVEGVLEGRPRV
jgi:N-methylhydantoinase A/oxoprolinase/acetone carboxylase beta subunit